MTKSWRTTACCRSEALERTAENFMAERRRNFQTTRQIGENREQSEFPHQAGPDIAFQNEMRNAF